MLGYQSSQILRIANPKDYENVTFDTLSFFCLMQLDELVLSNCGVTGLEKIRYLSAYAPFRSARASHAHVIIVAVVCAI